MGAGGVAGAELDGVAGDLHPVGRRGRGEGLEAEGGDGLAQRRIGCRGRSAVQEIAGLQMALADALQFIEDFLRRIQLVGPDVHHETAAVGDDIVGRARENLRHVQPDFAHLGRNARELVAAQLRDVVHRQIERIDPVAAGGVAAFAVGFAVYHQQPALAGRRPQAGGLADDGPVGHRQPVRGIGRLGERPFRSEQPAGPVGPGAFFFAGQQQQQIDGELLPVEMLQDGQHRNDAAAVIIGSQPVDDRGVRSRIIRVAGIAGGRWDGVEMRHQGQRLLGRIGLRGGHDNVSFRGFIGNALVVQPPADPGSCRLLME